ncbi:hypothetical protein FB451DRAFT_1190187 [Mycena latifolia]|nr:hypothetical protein FB451DRAFT_1190187 [Mycena latifolia]
MQEFTPDELEDARLPGSARVAARTLQGSSAAFYTRKKQGGRSEEGTETKRTASGSARTASRAGDVIFRSSSAADASAGNAEDGGIPGQENYLKLVRVAIEYMRDIFRTEMSQFEFSTKAARVDYMYVAMHSRPIPSVIYMKSNENEPIVPIGSVGTSRVVTFGSRKIELRFRLMIYKLSGGAVPSILRLLSACCPCLRPADTASALLASPPRRDSDGGDWMDGWMDGLQLQRGALRGHAEAERELGHDCARQGGGAFALLCFPLLLHHLTRRRAENGQPSDIAYSSPSGSRSSSRRRSEPAYAHGVWAKEASASASSEWFGESASTSESEVDDSAASATAAGACAAPVLDEPGVHPMPDEEAQRPAPPVPISSVRAEGEGAKGLGLRSHEAIPQPPSCPSSRLTNFFTGRSAPASSLFILGVLPLMLPRASTHCLAIRTFIPAPSRALVLGGVKLDSGAASPLLTIGPADASYLRILAEAESEKFQPGEIFLVQSTASPLTGGKQVGTCHNGFRMALAAASQGHLLNARAYSLELVRLQ